MLFSYLVLSHLIGDFLLQPGKLIKFKKRSKLGVLLHVFIHFLLMNIAILSLGVFAIKSIILITLYISITHFLIDLTKIYFDKTHKNLIVKSFLIDQLAHFLIIVSSLFIAAKLSGFSFFQLLVPDFSLNSSKLILYFVAIIIFTDFFDIFKFQFKRLEGKNPIFKRNCEKTLVTTIIISAVFLIIL